MLAFKHVLMQLRILYIPTQNQLCKCWELNCMEQKSSQFLHYLSSTCASGVGLLFQEYKFNHTSHNTLARHAYSHFQRATSGQMYVREGARADDFFT
jgi:hypothetical protein